jgi:hypothetical protein
MKSREGVREGVKVLVVYRTPAVVQPGKTLRTMMLCDQPV